MKMKFTALLMLLTATSFAQTIRRVNNNPGITGTNIYTTIQAAHDAAVNGDIIYVEASNTNYGGLNCLKNISIIGTGYFLNFNVQLQNENRSSKVGTITLRTGSDGTSISGLDVDGQIEGYGVSNVIVSRNKCKNIGFTAIRLTGASGYTQTTPSNYSNITIVQNFIDDPGVMKNGFGLLQIQSATAGGVTYNGSGILIANNFIGRDISTGLVVGGVGLILKNNIIDGKSIVSNATVENNFFIGGGGVFQSNDGNSNFAVNCVFQNNAARDVIFPAGYASSNQNSINPSLHFESVAGASPDSNLKLKSSSSLRTAGSGGGEIGMYGGDFPYVVSGIPSVPSFSLFNTSAVGSSTTPLSVTISTRSNN